MARTLFVTTHPPEALRERFARFPSRGAATIMGAAYFSHCERQLRL